MSNFFRRGMIFDNFLKDLPIYFFEKACFEKKINKILKFHVYIWICIEIRIKQRKKLKIEILCHDRFYRNSDEIVSIVVDKVVNVA